MNCVARTRPRISLRLRPKLSIGLWSPPVLISELVVELHRLVHTVEPAQTWKDRVHSEHRVEHRVLGGSCSHAIRIERFLVSTSIERTCLKGLCIMESMTLWIRTYERCSPNYPPSTAHHSQTTFVNPRPRLDRSHYPHPKAVQAIYHPVDPSVAEHCLAGVKVGDWRWIAQNERDLERCRGCLRRIDRGCIPGRFEVVDVLSATRRVGELEVGAEISARTLKPLRRKSTIPCKHEQDLLFSSSSSRYFAFLRTPSTHCFAIPFFTQRVQGRSRMRCQHSLALFLCARGNLTIIACDVTLLTSQTSFCYLFPALLLLPTTRSTWLSYRAR